MGGVGSGRYYCFGAKTTADSCARIDVNYLNRRGDLTPGRSWWLFWTRNGEPSSNIQGRTEADRVMLMYRFRRNEGEWQHVEQPVQIVRTPCNYGGSRPWFRCPGVVHGRVCGRRVGTLYAAGKYFLCRHCYDLGYQTRQESYADRMVTKAYKLRRRLGGEVRIDDYLPPKPKGMHCKTYNRICMEIQKAERSSLMMIAARFGFLR